MILSVILTLAAAFVFTEFVGYFLHILLHSNKVEFLSRNHMIHHLLVYKPKQTMRQGNAYLGSTHGRAAVGGVGMEWIAPIALILVAFFAAARAFGMPPYLQLLFVAAALLWGKFVFGTMHDAMHLKDFWMAKHPLTRAWFLGVRRYHDIHHMDIDDTGRMTRNFGICFFFMDRLLGTLARKARPFNEKGYARALGLYSYING